MWPYLTVFLALLLVAVHFYWRARCRDLERSLAGQLSKPGDWAVTERTTIPLIPRQKLFDGMAEGILMVDHARKIEGVNLALRRLLGLTGEVVGQPLSAALGRPDLDALVERAASEGEVLGEEIESPGPPPRVLQVNASRFLEGPASQSGVLVVFHDVSRIKQLETIRKEFVANVSHELRTPLSLIKGCVETLQDGALSDRQQADRFLQLIEKHTDRLVYLIEDLLTISRLESGKEVLNLETVEVAEVAQRVVDDLSARARARQVQIYNQIPAGMRARADADRLEQVFFNLVENAIKYGRESGEIWVDGRRVPENNLELRVRDNGPGIAPEARDRVFERFYRADRARARETGGTGLGLAIVKHIVQAHGGEVWISTELNQGASFYFILPAADSGTVIAS